MEVIRSMAKFNPHDYQKVAIEFALDKPASGLFLDMGLRQDSNRFNGDRRIKK